MVESAGNIRALGLVNDSKLASRSHREALEDRLSDRRESTPRPAVAAQWHGSRDGLRNGRASDRRRLPVFEIEDPLPVLLAKLRWHPGFVGASNRHRGGTAHLDRLDI